MRYLYDYTMKQVVDYLVDDIAESKGVSKVLAKKLLINALTYNLVTDEISSQIDFLLEREN